MALGLGYRFSYSVLFMTSKTESERRVGSRGYGVERRRRGRTYKSTSVGQSTPRIPSLVDLRGLFAGCAPRCSPFTMELTMDLRCGVRLTLRETRVSNRYQVTKPEFQCRWNKRKPRMVPKVESTVTRIASRRVSPALK